MAASAAAQVNFSLAQKKLEPLRRRLENYSSLSTAQSNDLREAMQLLLSAAKKGHADAQCDLGIMHNLVGWFWGYRVGAVLCG